MKPVKLMAMACLLLAGRVSADSILQLRLPTNDLVCDPTSQRIYASVPELLPHYVYAPVVETPIVAAKHGDASGVRGAAMLWPSV